LRKQYSYDERTKISRFKLLDKGVTYKVEVKPCKEDEPYATEFTGLQIAEAKVKILRAKKKEAELNKALAENRRQFMILVDRKVIYASQRRDLQEYLDNFLETKEVFYNKLRKLRGNKG